MTICGYGVMGARSIKYVVCCNLLRVAGAEGTMINARHDLGAN